MSDARTEAIHKAATELVEELVGTVTKEGNERWFHIIVRKMERIPDRCPPKPPNTKLPLVIGNVRFDQGPLGASISLATREQSLSYGKEQEVVRELLFVPAADLPKLKLWLNGE